MEGATRTDAAPPGRAPRKGERLEVEIDSLAFGGRGVARADGFVVFVAGGLPGDRVLAEVTKGKKRFAEARTVELLRAGADRVPDRCTHGGDPCPGAPWQGLPYERQLAEKQAQVEDALRRIGGLDGFEMEPIVPALEEWRYRNKLEYSFGAGAVGTADEGVALGFHARGRWDLIVDVDDCKLASEAGNAARNGVREWARMEDLAAYDAGARRGLLRNLVVREGRRTGQIQTRLVTTAARLPRPPVDLHTTIEGDSGGTDGPTGALGEERLHEELCGLRFEMSHGAFFQTNTEMAERLYGVAAEFAGLSGRERVFDLFCGIGTIGLTMARDAGQVWGLEIVPEAIDDAERNARRNKIENAKFFAGNARTGVRPLVEAAGKPDVVVVDPPRAGLSQKIVRRLIECEARRIVYVSCNPTTLAPNAKQLEEAGYKLRRVRPVDMFPQTPHIECVALLEKVGPGGTASAGAPGLTAAPAPTAEGAPTYGVAAAEGSAAAESSGPGPEEDAG
ncbi:MAG TPA: 23S rRNA (uracil(1939)-C(5))-methyltransferase RlmD [Solirubrobacterales bacterium]|nr:23S rRNA (uracil(1939)-C(5))-methyltransferase RlmD [Solirubrobacterales bacterium]